MEVFSPSLTLSSYWYYPVKLAFVYYVIRGMTGESLWSAALAVLLLLPGWLFVAMVVRSSLTVDRDRRVLLKQRGRVLDMGELDGLRILRTMLPFGVGVPKLVGEAGPVRALPLTKAAFVDPKARRGFRKLLSGRGE